MQTSVQKRPNIEFKKQNGSINAKIRENHYIGPAYHWLSYPTYQKTEWTNISCCCVLPKFNILSFGLTLAIRYG